MDTSAWPKKTVTVLLLAWDDVFLTKTNNCKRFVILHQCLFKDPYNRNTQKLLSRMKQVVCRFLQLISTLWRCKFSLKKEELPTYTEVWSKLCCDVTHFSLPSHWVTSPGQRLFHSIHTSNKYYVNSIASLHQSSLKSKCCKNKGFDETMLSYAATSLCEKYVNWQHWGYYMSLSSAPIILHV